MVPRPSERLEDAAREGQVPGVAQRSERRMGPGLGRLDLALDDLERADLHERPCAEGGDRAVHLFDVWRVGSEVATRPKRIRRGPDRLPWIRDVDHECVHLGFRDGRAAIAELELYAFSKSCGRNVFPSPVQEV